MFTRKNKTSNTATSAPPKRPTNNTATSAPSKRRRPATAAHLSDVAALHAVLSALDKLDLPDDRPLFADAKAALARSRELRDEFGRAERTYQDHYEQVRDQVVAGDISPADALASLDTLATTHAKTNHVADTLAWRLRDDVCERMDKRAVTLARREGKAVHDTLAALAARSVEQARTAAAEFVDLDAYAAAVKNAFEKKQWDDQRRRPRGWPTANLDNVPPAQYGAVGNLHAANDEFNQVREAGRLLRALCPDLDEGNGSTIYRATTNREIMGLLMNWTPEPLRLPLTDALGWEPGLWLPADSAARRGRRRMRRWFLPDPGEELAAEATRAAVAAVGQRQH